MFHVKCLVNKSAWYKWTLNSYLLQLFLSDLFSGQDTLLWTTPGLGFFSVSLSSDSKTQSVDLGKDGMLHPWWGKHTLKRFSSNQERPGPAMIIFAYLVPILSSLLQVRHYFLHFAKQESNRIDQGHTLRMCWSQALYLWVWGQNPQDTMPLWVPDGPFQVYLALWDQAYDGWLGPST